MRPRLILAIALCVALAVPAAASADPATQTGKSDTAVAYFGGSGYCVTLSLNDGTDRPVGPDLPRPSQWVSVQLFEWTGSYCDPIADKAVNPLDPDSFEIHGLTAAYVATEVPDVGNHDVSVDVAWVAVGTPSPDVEDNGDWSFVGKAVAAHLTGTVLVDGQPLVGEQESAILRTFNIAKNY
jgi:hypothetical protein